MFKGPSSSSSAEMLRRIYLNICEKGHFLIYDEQHEEEFPLEMLRWMLKG